MRLFPPLILTAVVATLLAASAHMLRRQYRDLWLTFPLDDQHAEYRIERQETPVLCKHSTPAPCTGGGWVSNYVLSYRPNKIETYDSVMIGRAAEELGKYVGKKVRIKGRWRIGGSTTQCIKDRCHLILGNSTDRAVVIDIQEIEELAR